VLPALIRGFDEARAAGAPTVMNWGTESPRREFLHVDDKASACIHLLEHFDGPDR
jgi:GDP-L-fucose synthase